ncbi:hypothetical protein NDU88_005121 [Pleurodeles waltl]|uniref:Uncharacterized protein n=1 Tax=Pleurodeles waltl TaxID=8319 RepID=A0AAV7VLV0_PLEWA|nr:hypothetical protein NDU88_005121 [Pleurodeles waltl]
MGTPPNVREAEFRSTSLKERKDSGRGAEESFKQTPKTEDAGEMPQGEKEDRQALERREGGESRVPETSIGRHDPGQGKQRIILNTNVEGGGGGTEGREKREHI